MQEIKHNWSREEIKAIYEKPFMDLIYEAASVHRQYHDPSEVQVSSLLSVKTGGCPEDCAYCPQAARYNTGLEAHKLLSVDRVVEFAGNAKSNGASRVCLGAAWREVRDNRDFDHVLEMVRQITDMEMEVCCTMGMITQEQADRLADAGLYAYNHNVDTSGEHYESIITTRKYEDRLETLGNVRKAKLSVCSGGIIGMGESIDDRVGMIHTLACLDPHPDSVPINALVPVDGTPMEGRPLVPIWDMVRMIATARIVMPASVVRLSAGRTQMSQEGQALCFMAGANSIFAGDKLLTTPNPAFNEDMQLFNDLNLKPRKAFTQPKSPVTADRDEVSA
ncbi:MAG: biotin synthase BioB [Flavobacteriales bacterium]|nr:biotin synthase BioB [Flavobacteriales bacterium]